MDCIELSESEAFIPKKLGAIRVFHDDGGFKIMKDGQIQEVQNCFVDKEIRNFSNEELGYFLGTIKDVEIDGHVQTLVESSAEDLRSLFQDGYTVTREKLNNEETLKIAALLAESAYVSISEMSGGEYCVHAKTRLPAGIWRYARFLHTKDSYLFCNNKSTDLKLYVCTIHRSK